MNSRTRRYVYSWWIDQLFDVRSNFFVQLICSLVSRSVLFCSDLHCYILSVTHRNVQIERHLIHSEATRRISIESQLEKQKCNCDHDDDDDTKH